MTGNMSGQLDLGGHRTDSIQPAAGPKPLTSGWVLGRSPGPSCEPLGCQGVRMNQSRVRSAIAAVVVALIGCAMIMIHSPTAEAGGKKGSVYTPVTVQNRCSVTVNIDYIHYQLGEINMGIRKHGEVTYHVKPNSILTIWRPGTKAVGYSVGWSARTVRLC